MNIKKGNPYSATITVTDSTGAAYDLTGKTIFFAVKNTDDATSTDDLAVITKDITSHTNAAGGITSLTLTAAQTNKAVGKYKYDFRIYQASPLVQLNSTKGFLYIIDIVTKRTS